MKLKIGFSFLLCLIFFISFQLSGKIREVDAVKNLEDRKSNCQNSQDSVWRLSISPFVELGGKGFLSLNIDFRIKETYAFSAGFLAEGFAPNVMGYYFIGKRHRFETGGGLSGGFSNDFNLSVLIVHGVLGYRYQKKKGLFFRAGLTPFYVKFMKDDKRSNKLYPFAGISLGYSF